jgi:5-methylcytosine-specific restriction endonuclease McrA
VDDCNTGAYAPVQKVIILRETNGVSTVAHEVIHTSHHLWSEDQMKQSFDGKNWHNHEQDHQAHGVNVKTREMQRDMKELRGTTSETKWITQGTCWYLPDVFQNQPDPEVFVVRALCARRGGGACQLQTVRIVSPTPG